MKLKRKMINSLLLLKIIMISSMNSINIHFTGKIAAMPPAEPGGIG